MILKPIGIIYTPFKKSVDTPIQSAQAANAEGHIRLFRDFVEGLRDLDGFERIWLLYWFDRAYAFKLLVKPYLDNQERGVFATRAPSRPNPIGLSCVRLLSIEAEIMRIAEVDMLDETPLLDIKPFIGKFDSFSVKKSGWIDKIEIKKKKGDERFEK
jgi:tRNA-Thr(GGU) m(6)t(6)A37 methyltransferase TsaA